MQPLTLICFSDSREGGRGRHISWQKRSSGCLTNRFPWKFQIQKALSTCDESSCKSVCFVSDPHNFLLLTLYKRSPKVWVNMRDTNSTRGTSSDGIYVPCIYSHASWVTVGDSDLLLLCLCDIFQGTWSVNQLQRNSSKRTDLVSPPADGGADETPGGIPFHIRGHEMLRLRHHRHVLSVHKLQHSIHAAQQEKHPFGQLSLYCYYLPKPFSHCWDSQQPAAPATTHTASLLRCSDVCNGWLFSEPEIIKLHSVIKVEGNFHRDLSLFEITFGGNSLYTF